MPFANSLHLLVFHAALSAFAVLLLRPDLLPLPLHQNLFVLERAVEVLDNLSPGNKMGHACADYVQLLLSTLRNSESSLKLHPLYSSFISTTLVKLSGLHLCALDAHPLSVDAELFITY